MARQRAHDILGRLFNVEYRGFGREVQKLFLQVQIIFQRAFIGFGFFLAGWWRRFGRGALILIHPWRRRGFDLGFHRGRRLVRR